MDRDYEEPAGPFHQHDIAGTICPICLRTWQTGEAWKWMLPANGSDHDLHVFAGYFCSDLCVATWRAADLRIRSRILFGKDEFVERLRQGFNPRTGKPLAMVLETEPDPEGVPIFSGLAKTGYRRRTPTGAWRAW